MYVNLTKNDYTVVSKVKQSNIMIQMDERNLQIVAKAAYRVGHRGLISSSVF